MSMDGTASPLNAYKNTGVATAPPEKLVLMMYDALLSSVDAAQKALSRGDRVAAHAALLKAQSIVEELTLALDRSRGGAVARNLDALYDFIGGALVKANLDKDGGILSDVRRVVSGLREAWLEGPCCLTSTSRGGDSQLINT